MTNPLPDQAGIPRRHEPLRMREIRPFAEWLDRQLQQLESHFADFVTPRSRRGRSARTLVESERR